MSSYVPTDWVDGTTPLDEAHLDKIEQGIKAVSDILFSGGRLATVGVLITDWNAATQNGWYRAAGSATNSPGPGVAAVGMTIADSPNYLVQIAYAHNDVTPPAPRIWFRTRIGGTWGAWALLSAGGGGGGGLDWEGAYAAATPYVKGDVVTYQGVTYGAVNDSTGQTPPAPAAPPVSGPIPLVTALPTPLFDGQEVILTDSLTAGTYRWRLRYNAGAASVYKWEFIGGNEASHYIATPENMAGAGWQNIATVGPRIFVPVSGDYFCQFAAAFTPPGTLSYMQAGVGIGDHAGASFAVTLATPAGTTYWSAMSMGVFSPLAAGGEIRMKYAQSAAQATQVSQRLLLVRPIRVG